MLSKTLVIAGVSALSFTLAACGGGAGAGVASIPPSPTTPSPPPPPPPPPPPLLTTAGPVKIFDGINASTQFATVGLESSGGPNNTLSNNGFSVRYDASAGTYMMDFPSTPEGGFYQNGGATPNSHFWSGYVGEASGNAYAGAYVLKPSNPDLQLTYTSYVSYDGSLMSPEPFGFVAFGTATTPGAMPVTGSATYEALADGITFDPGYYIRGSAALQFNFGNGTLAGHFDPLIYDLGGGALSLGRYDFVNTVYSVGSPTFSGELAHSGIADHGSFDGLFTGPSAQELMARWTAPYVNPNTHATSTMFGVWVGKTGP